MNYEKTIGQFICELRKSKKMTQKDLAAKLNITDKAVSKWERGLSCPDISLLPVIADIFGVTTGELLNGEKSNVPSKELEAGIDSAFQYAGQAAQNKWKRLHNIGAAAFSFILFAGMLVCVICDIAISGAFTWSLYPISSILFTWMVLFPVIKFGKKGISGTLIAISALIIPFLMALNALIKGGGLILPIGIRVSVISILFMWSVFVLFKLLKNRKWIAAAVSFLLAIPTSLFINLILIKFISGPFIDVWDILSFSIIAVTAVVFIAIDYVNRNK